MKIRFVVLMAVMSFSFALSSVATAQAGDTAEANALREAKSGLGNKLGPWLATLYDDYTSSQRGRRSAAFETLLPAIMTRNGNVRIEGVAENGTELRASLESMGATDILQAGQLFSANVPIAALADLGSEPSLRFAGPVAARTRASQGAVVGQGDEAVNAFAARMLGVDGTGIRVGILSDSFACDEVVFAPGAPNPRSAEDMANEDVDPFVLILEDACPGGSDEGRGMANLIKDVAPGSPQAFHTAFLSRLDFALGILELGGISTGYSDPPVSAYVPTTGAEVSDVIVDDVIYFVEPMFSPGQIAQAANTVAEAGIPYFSSAGNNARNSYEADFEPTWRTGNNGRNLNNGAAPGPNATLRHDFDPGPGVDDTQTITVFPDASGLGVTVFSFQWDQPHASSTAFANTAAGDLSTPPIGATSDVDFVIYDRNGILVPFCPAVGLAVGITCQLTGVNNIGRDAVELAALIYNGTPSQGPAQFQISIVVSGGPPPGRVKYVPFDFSGTIAINEWDTQSGTAYGHSNGEHVASVAAAAFYFTQAFDGDTPNDDNGRLPAGTCIAGGSAACLEDFSSAGEIPILFDKFGNSINEIVPDNPRFTGVDGSNTSFFAFDSSFDDDDADGANSPFSTFVSLTLDEDPASEIPNFFGTSASAPNVAAVAALMLEKNPTLSAQDVYDILSSTALPVNLREGPYDPNQQPILIPDEPSRPGFNYDSGHGLVDAEAAVMATPNP